MGVTLFVGGYKKRGVTLFVGGILRYTFLVFILMDFGVCCGLLDFLYVQRSRVTALLAGAVLAHCLA